MSLSFGDIKVLFPLLNEPFDVFFVKKYPPSYANGAEPNTLSPAFILDTSDRYAQLSCCFIL